ncbi:hypothetical protein GEV33_009398 [Tenebrio molitor]|uniref:Uncharacterized protein n=1 Tax=Tenebrio molitor TaxID=7067 RepID=A0A8J6HGU1_TENMO|nr:hypothetical protein GEV33_009398 [Tenebrio molitor]
MFKFRGKITLQSSPTSVVKKREKRERSRTFQNGLSDPDFRYRPRQVGERRGKRYKGGTDAMKMVLERLSTGSRLVQGEIRGCFSVQQELANPWRKTESAGKSSQRNPNRNAAADKGFIHEGQRPYAQAETPPESRTSHRTVPGRGTRVQEQHVSGKVLQRLSFCSPPSWLISFTLIHVIRPGVTSPETTRSLGLNFFHFFTGAQGLTVHVFLWEGSRGGRTRGLSEDTGGVIDQRRKKDSEDLPPAPFFPGLIF